MAEIMAEIGIVLQATLFLRDELLDRFHTNSASYEVKFCGIYWNSENFIFGLGLIIEIQTFSVLAPIN